MHPVYYPTNIPDFRSEFSFIFLNNFGRKCDPVCDIEFSLVVLKKSLLFFIQSLSSSQSDVLILGFCALCDKCGEFDRL